MNDGTEIVYTYTTDTSSSLRMDSYHSVSNHNLNYRLANIQSCGISLGDAVSYNCTCDFCKETNPNVMNLSAHGKSLAICVEHMMFVFSKLSERFNRPVERPCSLPKELFEEIK